MAKTTEKFPPNFTRGVPTEPGCYVFLTMDRFGFELMVRDLDNVSAEHAEELGVEPGLCVWNCPDMYYMEADRFGIVGYLKLEGVSAMGLYLAKELEVPGDAVLIPGEDE